MTQPTFDPSAGGTLGIPPPTMGGDPTAPITAPSVPTGWSGTQDEFAVSAASIGSAQALAKSLPSTAGSPVLPSAKTSGASGDPAVTGNKWFNPSFLAAFSAVMDEVLKLRKDTAYREAQLSISQAQSLLEQAKSSADLTRALYNTRAQEKITEAITSFVGAGVSLAGAWDSAKSSVTARSKLAQDPEYQKVEGRINASDPTKIPAKETALQQKTADLTAKEKALEEKTTIANQLDDDPNASGVQTYEAMNARDQAQREVDAAKLSKNQAEKELNEARAVTPQDRTADLRLKQEMITQKTAEIDRQVQMKTDVMKQAVQGTNSALQASYTSQEGEIEAEKTMLDAKQQLMNRWLDNAMKARDSAQSDFAAVCDFINRITDSNYQTFTLRGH